jgi:hypothetical protein
VERLVENFILQTSLPFRIITGNSIVMKMLVQSVLDEHLFTYGPENDWNLGSIIVEK